MLQRRANAELFDFVPRTAFRPIPKVDSFIVQIRAKNKTEEERTGIFDDVVRILFSQRRRKASTVLRHWLEKSGMFPAKIPIDSLNIPAKRVFELTAEDIEIICRNLQQNRVESAKLL